VRLAFRKCSLSPVYRRDIPLSQGLWQRTITAEPEDRIDVFEQAAMLRYYDGRELLGDQRHYAGAIYLLGYCVELVLKVAYCRMVGVGPADPVWSNVQALTGRAPATVKHH
jgi:hypothetical protein